MHPAAVIGRTTAHGDTGKEAHGSPEAPKFRASLMGSRLSASAPIITMLISLYMTSVAGRRRWIAK